MTTPDTSRWPDGPEQTRYTNSLIKNNTKTIRSLYVATITAVLSLNLVLAGCSREPVERTAAELQIDQQLGDQVKAALEQSAAFKFPDVRVASFKGRIQLSGFVQSDDQKQSAGSIAKGVRGVVDVENNISLKQ